MVATKRGRTETGENATVAAGDVSACARPTPDLVYQGVPGCYHEANALPKKKSIMRGGHCSSEGDERNPRIGEESRFTFVIASIALDVGPRGIGSSTRIS